MEKGNGRKRHIPEQRHKDRQLRIQMLNEERVREVGGGGCKELNAKTKKHCEQLLLCLRKNLRRYANLLYCHGTNGSFDATDVFKPNKKLQP